MDFFISFRAQDSEAARPILSALECRADQLYDWVLFLKVRDAVIDTYHQFPHAGQGASKVYRADCVGAFIKNRGDQKKFAVRDEFSCFGAVSNCESYVQICGKFTKPYATETEWVIDFYGELCLDIESKLTKAAWASRDNSNSAMSSFDRLLAALRGPANRASSTRHIALLQSTDDRFSGAYFRSGAPHNFNFSSANQLHLIGAMWRAWEVTLAPGLVSRSGAKIAGYAVAAYQQRIEAAFNLIRLSTMRSRTSMPFRVINGNENDPCDNAETSESLKTTEANDQPRKLVHFFPRTFKKLTRKSKIIVEPPVEADLSWTSNLPLTNFAEVFHKYLNGEKIIISPDRKG